MNEVVTFGSEDGATARRTGLSAIFQRNANKAVTAHGPTKSPEVSDALRQVDQLATHYKQLKTEILDRSDSALWSFLGGVYDYVLRINKSVQKQQIKKDLLTVIKMRDHISLSSALPTEAIVIRYVFSDMARQSRNNYVVLMQKALALDIKQGELLNFLVQYGGVSSVVDKIFDSIEMSSAGEKEQRQTQRTDSINLMRRLFVLMSQTEGVTPVNTEQVTDWIPSARELSTVKAADKTAAKYQPGDFVFFVAMPDTTQGQYKLIQGFSATRDFEDPFLLQIATRLGASNEQLQNLVAEFEASMQT
jgi:hypothetical protein